MVATLSQHLENVGVATSRLCLWSDSGKHFGVQFSVPPYPVYSRQKGFQLNIKGKSALKPAFAPQVVRPEEAQTAASLMVALLGLGLGSGAFLSNFFAKLI